MAAEPKQRAFVECMTPEGRVLATVEVFAVGDSATTTNESHPLVLYPADEARLNGEERLQLRERGRYEYRLRPLPNAPHDLVLLSHRGVQPSHVKSDGEDRGLIEPQDH